MYGSQSNSRDLNLAFEMPSSEREREEKAKSSSSSPMIYCSFPRDQFLASQEIRPGNLNSSASGLFSELTLEQGDALSRGVFGVQWTAASTGEDTPAESRRLKNRAITPTRQPHSLDSISHISEIPGDALSRGVFGVQWTAASTGEDTPAESRRLKNRAITPTRQPHSLDSISHISEIPGLHLSSWNDHSLLSENFGDFSRRTSDPQELQNSEAGIHFGSPRTPQSSLLQFQDAVPCKIRAKRGCATHPRSIAERERRTRISERIKKLQELVPKMDKQLSTAEMLDMALDYIKELQEQVKALSKNKAYCTCQNNSGE